MKTTKLTLAVASMFLATAMFVACKKNSNSTTAVDSDTSGAGDNTMAESTSNDVVNIAGQVSENGSLSSYRLGDQENMLTTCASVTTNTTTQTFTVTFSGHACLDGHTRTGSLMYDYHTSTSNAIWFRIPGWACTVSSSNYVVDGNAITVNKTISNSTATTFTPTATNLTWAISGTITVVKPNNGGTINWVCNRTKTLLNTSDTAVYHGYSLPISWNKAKLGITGSASGTDSKGENFNATITSQLVLDMTCSPDVNNVGHHPFIQGGIDFTPGTKATRHIDFGSGTCDLNYTVTINGNTYNLTMP